MLEELATIPLYNYYITTPFPLWPTVLRHPRGIPLHVRQHTCPPNLSIMVQETNAQYMLAQPSYGVYTAHLLMPIHVGLSTSCGQGIYGYHPTRSHQIP
jgi:hypothetical protein